MLRGLANYEVEQLDDERRHDQPDQEAFRLVPDPGLQLLIGEIKPVLQAEAVVVKSQAEYFADQQKHAHVQKYGKTVILKGATVGQVAQPSAPICGQQ